MGRPHDKGSHAKNYASNYDLLTKKTLCQSIQVIVGPLKNEIRKQNNKDLNFKGTCFTIIN